MVVCATFAAGQLGPFELTVYANTAGVAVDQVYPPTWRSSGSAPSPTEVAEATPLEEED
jgi:hypothetical protein